MIRWLSTPVALGVLLSGCSEGRLPTQPTSSATLTPSLAEPRFLVRVDSLGSAVAIAGLSQVTFDARETAGDKLQYEVQFGDGASASTAFATHVYQSDGTFVATLFITDAAGRRTSASQSITVKTLRGTWFYFDYNERTRAPDLRRLTISASEGANPSAASGFEPPGLRVSGVYSTLDGDRAVTGTLTGERDLQLMVDGGLQLAGTVPGDIIVEGQPWLLSVRGGSADGLTLPFRPIVGAPVGSPPVARLTLRHDTANFFFPLMGFTPVTFDALASTGDGLLSVLEFGDGAFTRELSAVHRSNQCCSLVARLTVVDRFGRTDVRTNQFRVGTLRDSLGSLWFHSFSNPKTGSFEGRQLTFTTHDGSRVTGVYSHPNGQQSRFTGTVDEQGIRLILDGGGIEFIGSVVIPGATLKNRMSLLLRGGSADGLTLHFNHADGF